MAKRSKTRPKIDWQQNEQDVAENHKKAYSARSMEVMCRTSVEDYEYFGLKGYELDEMSMRLQVLIENGCLQQAVTEVLCTIDYLKARVQAVVMAIQKAKPRIGPLIGIGLKMKSAPVKARAIKAAIDKANYDEIKCALQAELDANPHNSLTQARHRLANLQDEDGNPIYAGYSTVKKATKGMKGPQKKKK